MSTTLSTYATSADMDAGTASPVFDTLAEFCEWLEECRERREQAATTPALGAACSSSPRASGEPPLLSSPASADAGCGHLPPADTLLSSPTPADASLGQVTLTPVSPAHKPGVSPSQPRKKGLKRSSRACLCCEKRKRKCEPSEGGPGCQRCVNAGTECQFPPEMRTHGQQREAMERAAAAGKPYTPVRQARAARKEATCSPRNA